MTTRYIILTSFIMLSFIAHAQQSKNNPEKARSKQLQFAVTEDDIAPPPQNLTTKFKTLQAWLIDICSNSTPPKSIAKYNFGLFESPNSYTLVLTGVNTYNERTNGSITRIEFKPKEMYFPLPKAFYENLNRKQLLDKLIFQLKGFSHTKEFKTSFFAKANVLIFDTTGQSLWSKE